MDANCTQQLFNGMHDSVTERLPQYLIWHCHEWGVLVKIKNNSGILFLMINTSRKYCNCWKSYLTNQFSNSYILRINFCSYRIPTKIYK